MTVDVVIENGTVVTSFGALRTDIAISGEKVLALGDKSAFPKAERVIDAGGKIVIPGAIDTHSHIECTILWHDLFKEEPQENWDAATVAAAIGGTTTTIDFATQAIGSSLLDAVKTQFARAKELSAIDYTTKPIIKDLKDLDKLLDSIKEVIDYGIPSFKGATIYRNTGWYEDDWQLYSILRRIKELGGMMTIHAENCLIGEEQAAELVRQGKTEPKYHALAKPNFVENLAIQTCMTLAETLGTRTYIVHTSSKEGPDIIDSYRRKGLPVFCETCPHYLVLTDDVLEPKFPRGILHVCSPPFRKKEDVEALWQAIKEGKVQTIGTDHVAYQKRHKEEHCDTFTDIPNGLPGIELLVPVIFSEGVIKRGLSLERFVEVVSTNAAKIFGFYPKKGVIAPGSDADIVIIDPDRKHSLNAADLHMKTDFSIFEGMEVTGWPVMTMLRGKVIVENEKFVGQPGDGEFVRVDIKDFKPESAIGG
jgi:dihydropyrimidinase